MPQGINERQRQRLFLLGKGTARELLGYLDEEQIEPTLDNPAAIEALKAWWLGLASGAGISSDNVDAMFAQTIASKLQHLKPERTLS
jgi:hypothetical protein